MNSPAASPARIVLVGFMASGKTSVGRELARLLGWDFVDFDEEIEAEAGAPIPEIFSEQGEPAFRELEERVGRRLLELEGAVLATGGGWGAVEGRLEDLPGGTFSVWLRIG
ncbi:MAG: shikimate kinase, partial [Longimicrobiales bacterium]|nr:shikimate kinase [Longimicrobiales bacterium]